MKQREFYEHILKNELTSLRYLHEKGVLEIACHVTCYKCEENVVLKPKKVRVNKPVC